ncbi:hypothetical protein ACLOJK_002069 [Asimina triloba]
MPFMLCIPAIDGLYRLICIMYSAGFPSHLSDKLPLFLVLLLSCSGGFHPIAPTFSGFPPSPAADVQMLPIMYPLLVPGFVPLQNQEQNSRGGGIYAVPVVPSMGLVSGPTTNALIPLTYNVPTPSPSEGSVGGEHGQEGRQQHAQQRQVVVRRFQFAFQLDLLLILKLAARAGAPPHPQPGARADNGHPARPENENAPLLPEGQPGAENANQAAENANQAAENDNRPEPRGRDGINWWGIAREIQMIVVGFVTSLLPGFHNAD